MQPRIDAIVRLGRINPQTACLMLYSGANSYISYLLRVTPTHLILEAADKFDFMIMEALEEIITLHVPHFAKSVDSIETLDNANACILAQLPIRDGGYAQLLTALDQLS